MPNANEYDLGDMVRVSASFTNIDGVAADPTAVTLQVRRPDTSITTYTYGADPEIVKTDVGQYRADLDIDQEGTWRFRWAGVGAVQAAHESVFYIRDSYFA